MKICFISTWEQECGIAEYTKAIAKTLVSQEHDVSILTEIIPRPKSTDSIPSYAVWHRSNWAKPCLAAIKKIQPDIVHIQHEFGIFPRTTELNSFIDECDIPVIVTLHTVPRQNIQLSKEANYIAHTHGGQYQLATLGVDSHHIPHWIRSSVQIPHLDIWNHYNLPPNFLKIILVPGFINEDKAQLETLRAFKKSSLSKSDTALLFVGVAKDTSYLNQLMFEADTFGHPAIRIDPRFVDNNFRDELYMQSSLVVLNTKKETEFSASGQLHTAVGFRKPVLAKNVEIFREPLGAAHLFTDNLVEKMEGLYYQQDSQQRLNQESIASNQGLFKTANLHIKLYEGRL